tara:strand:+ start:113 stop:2443 length:2331 start_codon:yes stop_codon:yes gene_type:complete
MSKLVIVESPAKCKKIQGYLGNDYIVKSSYGHFRDLEKKKLGVDIENNFKPNYVLLEDKKKVVNDLKSTFKKCKTLILAADQDREGEAIAWHLNEVLNKGKDTSERIVFNEITKTALVNAVNNPIKININMFYAQQARRVIDRIVGFLISPMLWKNIQSSYKKGQGLSAGRVQSVVNKLIIEREKKINSFEKKSYFNLIGNLEFNGNKIPIKYSKTKELDNFENKIKPIFDLANTDKFIVSDIKKKEKKENAKAPYITSTLQQEAHSKLNMNSKQTMMIAQRLYENGLITYMRTDSIIISEDALKEIKSEVLNLYGNEYYKKNVFKSKTKNAQEAHECCRVTDIKMRNIDKDKYSHDECRLYELIWKKTISSQMSPMIKDVLDVSINLNDYVFNSSYEKVKFDGYMRVYNVNKESKNDSLLELKKKSVLDFIDFSGEQKFTTPETRYNDSSLVKKLEELGIGRPSTFSNMVNSVLDKNYAVIKDNPGIDIDICNHYLKKNDYSCKKDVIKYGNDKSKITPTQIGIIINDYLDKYFNQIINYDFTALMETELDKISSGEESWCNIVNDCYNKIKISIENSPKKIVKDDYSNVLGLNPTNNKYISVYIGQYGPVIKEYCDNSSIKPRFISIKDIDIKNISLDEAIELLKYPYVIGSYNDKDLILDNGRYGLYIKYDNKNYSIPNLDENDINCDEIINVISQKMKSNTGLIRKINDKISIFNGPYGYYIKYNNKSNFKIIFHSDFSQDNINEYVDKLSVKDCNIIIEKEKSKKVNKKKK